MNATQGRTSPMLRRLPAGARQALADKAVARSSQVARDQFARTFADVLSGRFGGRWSVEWKGADRPLPAANRNGRALSGKK